MPSSASLRKPSSQLRFELLTLGDELLLGLTVNGHSHSSGRNLPAARGAPAQCDPNDDADAIARQFRESWHCRRRHHTGGLGPTCDDARAKRCGGARLKLVFIPRSRSRSSTACIVRRKMTPNNLKQATGSTTAHSAQRQRDGARLWVERTARCSACCPVPRTSCSPCLSSRSCRAWRHSAAARKRGVCADSHAGGRVDAGDAAAAGFRPVREALSVASARMRARGLRSVRREASSAARSSKASRRMRRLLGEDFMCFGYDSLPRSARTFCARRRRPWRWRKRTGGLFANSFTEVLGKSKFFAGGCVCYTNERSGASRGAGMHPAAARRGQPGSRGGDGTAAAKARRGLRMAITGFVAPVEAPRRTRSARFTSRFTRPTVWSKN